MKRRAAFSPKLGQFGPNWVNKFFCILSSFLSLSRCFLLLTCVYNCSIHFVFWLLDYSLLHTSSLLLVWFFHRIHNSINGGEISNPIFFFIIPLFNSIIYTDKSSSIISPKLKLKYILICSVTDEESEWLFTVLRCGGGWVFIMEEKGACRHVSTPTLKQVEVVMWEMW